MLSRTAPPRRVRARALAIFRALVFALCLAAPAALSQQTATVTRNVFLRPAPSTDNQPIRRLLPPDELELVEPGETNGFLRVRTVEGDEEGWVWANNVHVADAALNPSLAPAAAAEAVSEAWPKPAMTVGNFTSNGRTCGPAGSTPGNETNRRKNRTDAPAAYNAVTFDALTRLPDLRVPKDRSRWGAADAAEIAKFEGAAVTVIGYLVAIKPQNRGSGETTNCKWTAYAESDWHMALVEEPGQGEALAFVVETTPRVRRRHPNWTEANLDPWLETDIPVRISGWLMFDPEHRNHMGRYRQSMWEIHPITKIEVLRGRQWVDLDDF
jgi:Bacterial SH3 domain